MNILFSGGDNWWPAIIGSKAVHVLQYGTPVRHRRIMATPE